jgi:hypothetical protein
MGQTSSQLSLDEASDMEEESTNPVEIIPDSQPNLDTPLPSDRNSPPERTNVKRKRIHMSSQNSVEYDNGEATNHLDYARMSVNGDLTQIVPDSQPSRKRRRSDKALSSTNSPPTARTYGSRKHTPNGIQSSIADESEEEAGEAVNGSNPATASQTADSTSNSRKLPMSDMYDIIASTDDEQQSKKPRESKAGRRKSSNKDGDGHPSSGMLQGTFSKPEFELLQQYVYGYADENAMTKEDVHNMIQETMPRRCPTEFWEDLF